MSAAFKNVSDVRMSTNVLVEHDRVLLSSVHGRRSHSVSTSYVYKLTSAGNGLQKAEAKSYSYIGAQRRIVRVRLRIADLLRHLQAVCPVNAATEKQSNKSLSSPATCMHARSDLSNEPDGLGSVSLSHLAKFTRCPH